MRRGKTMLVNTLLLTLTSLVMRGVAMIFQVYLSRAVGASGIGLFQLIMSVSVLASTLAISGIRFAATRLVSEQLGLGRERCVADTVRRCLIYALSFGLLAAFLLYSGAGVIGQRWIKDVRSVPSLRLLAVSMPFLSMSCVLSGYFTAVCRVIKSAAVQFIEQLVRIGVIYAAFSLSGAAGDVQTACAVIVAGGVAGDFSSFLLQYVLYVLDRRKYGCTGASDTGVTKRIFGVALPLAASAYARTGLSTLQNLLVPRGFERSGSSAESALADYGTITGMVFPVITFPSALFYSLAELIVPELTEAQVRGDSGAIRELVGRTLRLCLLFSLCVAAALFRFSRELGMTIYDDASVGGYIRVMSLLMPVMYLDSVTDGMLRGLGQHMRSMYYNIADSVLSVILVYFLLPRWAVWGYVFVLYFSEMFNFTLSYGRLRKITGVRPSYMSMLKALLSALGAVNIAMLLLRTVGLTLDATGLSLTLHIFLSFAVYVLLLLVFGCVDERDRRWLGRIFHR